MRSLWKGAISFGLVNIPIRMYAATENKSISFNQLHKVCYTPIRYTRHCPNCQRQVEQEELVHGYAYEPERFVIVEEQDLENIPLPSAHTIEILDFINLNEVDPIFYEKSYYLEPVEGAIKPYTLLRKAMLTSGKVALAKVAIRSKESLCAVRVFQNALSLVTMHYPDAVRPLNELSGISEDPIMSESEMRMAIQLIDNLTTAFNPTRYQDNYRNALLQLIETKVAGKQVHPISTTPINTPVVDLLAALEASLQATAPRQRQNAPGKKEPALVGADGKARRQ